MTRRDDDELLAGILARTSGSPCRRAGELLASSGGTPESGGERLPSVDRELLALHLERCADCRELAAVLAALSRDLPGLGEVRPDPELVGDVLGATLPATVRWRRAWERRWNGWVRRPRFAWEAALVLTVALSVSLTAAGSPERPIPRTFVELARRNPVQALGPPAAALRERVEPAAREVAEAIGPAGNTLEEALETPELREAAADWLEAIRAVPAAIETGALSFVQSLVRHLPGAESQGARERRGTFSGDGASVLERGAEAPSESTDEPNAPGPADEWDPSERRRP